MEQYRQVTVTTVMEETMNQEQSIQQRASPKIRCMMHFLQLMQLEQRNWFPESIIQMYLCLGIVILEVDGRHSGRRTESCRNAV